MDVSVIIMNHDEALQFFSQDSIGATRLVPFSLVSLLGRLIALPMEKRRPSALVRQFSALLFFTLYF